MYIYYYLPITFLCISFEIYNNNIIVTKGEDHIDVKTGFISMTRINQKVQEKDSDKNSRK